MVLFTKDFLKDRMEKLAWKVGDHSYGAPLVVAHGRSGKLVIGKYCSIASGVSIFLGAEHRADWVTTYPFPAFRLDWPSAQKIAGHPATKGDVVIGNDVWIGNGARIMSGVTIGHGAVIGNSALISVDVPDYGIAIGNPARTLKKRFSEETISRLLRLKWWDWDDQKVMDAVPLMCSTDIESFLQTYEASSSVAAP